MVRCLRWGFLLGDVMAVGSSISNLGGADPNDFAMTVAVLFIATVSMACTVGYGILHSLHKGPAILSFADVA
jgi:hypothetical protein